MLNWIIAHLIELKPATQTIGDQEFRVQTLDFSYQPATHLDGGGMKITLETHDTRNTTTILRAWEGINVNIGNQSQQIQIGCSDLLFPQVAGGVIDMMAANGSQLSGQFAIEL
jgi:hypothetical protein